jgi:chromatin segregation and condensation protein Rec8/ScpA/Scc1 (kleisin family)
VAVTELVCTWDELFAAALRLTGRPKPPEAHVIALRAVPIEEKMGLIVRTLARLARVEFRRLVEPFGDRLHGVVTFLAGLELSKRRLLSMRQSGPFADIWLYRRDDPDPDPDAEYVAAGGRPEGTHAVDADR